MRLHFHPDEKGATTNDLNYLRFPKGISQREAIAFVNLAALLMFVAVELGFSFFNFPTPRAMLLVATIAAVFRCSELVLSRSRSPVSSDSLKICAILSIAAGILIPFALAAATRQFHTHYFGLLILQVLEGALYFSLPTTLFIATVASSSAGLWVPYAAHFMPPYQLGEMLETATLILLLYTVGTLVWAFLNLLDKREAELRDRLQDLDITRGRMVQEESLLQPDAWQAPLRTRFATRRHHLQRHGSCGVINSLGGRA